MKFDQSKTFPPKLMFSLVEISKSLSQSLVEMTLEMFKTSCIVVEMENKHHENRRANRVLGM